MANSPKLPTETAKLSFFFKKETDKEGLGVLGEERGEIKSESCNGNDSEK